MRVVFIDSKLEKEVLSFEKPTVAKVIRLLALLEKFGEKLAMPYVKKLGNNFYELRVRGNQEVRIFYCFHGNQTIAVHSIINIKKSQKIPKHELETALSRIRLLTTT